MRSSRSASAPADLVGGDRLGDHRRLIALSAAIAALEALLIVSLGPADAVPLAPQSVAVLPFGVFHDLRWMLVYHSSWVVFVLEVVGVVAARTLLETALLRQAWPRDVEPPAFADLARRLGRVVVVQTLVLLPFATLLFAMAVTSLTWLFFVAIPVLVMVALLVHHGAVEPRWWRDAPSPASVRATLLSFGVITVGGAVIAVAPSWLQPVLAGGVGAALGWCRVLMVRALVGREVRARRVPFALVGVAGVFALVIGGTAIGFTVAVAVESARTPVLVVSGRGSAPPVLVVKGFNSEWNGITRRWVRGDYRIERFSYAGLDARGRPQPYERADTHGPVDALVRRMRAQVQALARASGDEVSIVAESEGALIAQAYLASTPEARVRSIVLLSPLLQPGRVYYPDAHHEGWGVVSGTILDGLGAALGWVGPVEVSANAPVFRSIVEAEPALGRLLSCPPPGVRSFAVLPLDSGVSAPALADIGYDHAVVPAFHGGLLGDGKTQELIGRVLRGEPAVGSSVLASLGDVINAGAAAWQAPSLDRSLQASWDDSEDAVDCEHVRSALQTLLD